MGLQYDLTDPIGSRAVLGLIVLQCDETIEHDFRRCFPQGDVAVYVSRVPSGAEVTTGTLAAMETELPRAAALLPPSLRYDAVGYGCTSGATVIGPDRVGTLVAGAADVAAVTNPLSAVRAALAAFGVTRVGLVSPYIAEVTAPLIAALELGGVTVAASVSFDEAVEARVARIDPASIEAAALDVARARGVEAVFLSCTNLRTLDLIGRVEAATGIPVVSSNQALAWHMAQLAGVDDGPVYGALMGRSLPRTKAQPAKGSRLKREPPAGILDNQRGTGMSTIAAYWQNFIAGDWVDGGGGRLWVENPGTGARLAEQAVADAGDVGRAVASARECVESRVLADMRPIERGRLVQAMGRWIADHAAEFAQVLTLEQGKPLWEAQAELRGACNYFEYYGNQAATVEGRSIPLGAGYFDFTMLEPFGVSAQIIPWNFPLEVAARSIAAGLATGNACVVKTSELTPLSGSCFARAAEAVGLPKGALHVLTGYGHEAGAALAAHPDVNQIVFTGSVRTGQAIAAAAAKTVVPCVLELGGKSAAIVHEDADLQAFETDVRRGIFVNAGQICSAMSRIVVHESRHDELVERIAGVAKGLSVGPGIERATFGPTMGPMISERQRDRAEGMVAEAERAGATVVTGGHRLNLPGSFLEPTVLADVTPDMAIAQEEVFGPVVSVMAFRDEARAIEIANGTPYGLVAGVFTRDLDRATRAARALRAGQVFVNEWFAGGVETPFGGYGKSGYGREKGREALMNYVQTKNVAIRTG